MSKSFLIAWVMSLLTLCDACATSVRPLALDEMAVVSNTIFQGKCIDNRSERETNTRLIVTYTTFEVHETLKGKLGATHVIKQIGGTLKNENASFNVEGVPTFTVGEEYVVFLTGVSSAGFSSPLGLSQGRFSITTGPSGKRVGNGRDLREMTATIPDRQVPLSMQQEQASSGRFADIDLADFKGLVQQLSGSAK